MCVSCPHAPGAPAAGDGAEVADEEALLPRCVGATTLPTVTALPADEFVEVVVLGAALSSTDWMRVRVVIDKRPEGSRSMDMRARKSEGLDTASSSSSCMVPPAPPLGAAAGLGGAAVAAGCGVGAPAALLPVLGWGAGMLAVFLLAVLDAAAAPVPAFKGDGHGDC